MIDEPFTASTTAAKMCSARRTCEVKEYSNLSHHVPGVLLDLHPFGFGAACPLFICVVSSQSALDVSVKRATTDDGGDVWHSCFLQSKQKAKSPILSHTLRGARYP